MILLIRAIPIWTYHVGGGRTVPTIIGQRELLRTGFLDFCLPRIQFFYIIIEFKGDLPRLNLFIVLFFHHELGAEAATPIVPFLNVVVAAAEIRLGNNLKEGRKVTILFYSVIGLKRKIQYRIGILCIM